MADMTDILKMAREYGGLIVYPVITGSLFTAHPRENHLTNSVATTATQVSVNQPNRISFIAVNWGANAGVIAPNAGVTMTQGIPVPASGGMVRFNYIEDADLVTLSFFAITTVAPGTWYFLELLSDYGIRHNG